MKVLDYYVDDYKSIGFCSLNKNHEKIRINFDNLQNSTRIEILKIIEDSYWTETDIDFNKIAEILGR